MRQSRIAYLAGLFDGEGSVSLYGDLRRQWVIAISTANAVREPLDEARDFFGGYIESVNRSGSLGKRTIFRWRLTGKRAEAALRAFLPHLRIKRWQALLALLYRTGSPQKRGQKVLPQTIKHRAQMRETIKDMGYVGWYDHNDPLREAG